MNSNLSNQIYFNILNYERTWYIIFYLILLIFHYNLLNFINFVNIRIYSKSITLFKFKEIKLFKLKNINISITIKIYISFSDKLGKIHVFDNIAKSKFNIYEILVQILQKL